MAKKIVAEQSNENKSATLPRSLSVERREDRKRDGKGREIGMLVSESHPLTPVFRRIVQSITPPSLSHHHLRGGPKHYLPI